MKASLRKDNYKDCSFISSFVRLVTDHLTDMPWFAEHVSLIMEWLSEKSLNMWRLGMYYGIFFKNWLNILKNCIILIINNNSPLDVVIVTTGTPPVSSDQLLHVWQQQQRDQCQHQTAVNLQVRRFSCFNFPTSWQMFSRFRCISSSKCGGV